MIAAARPRAVVERALAAARGRARPTAASGRTTSIDRPQTPSRTIASAAPASAPSAPVGDPRSRRGRWSARRRIRTWPPVTRERGGARHAAAAVEVLERQRGERARRPRRRRRASARLGHGGARYEERSRTPLRQRVVRAAGRAALMPLRYPYRPRGQSSGGKGGVAARSGWSASARRPRRAARRKRLQLVGGVLLGVAAIAASSWWSCSAAGGGDDESEAAAPAAGSAAARAPRAGRPPT